MILNFPQHFMFASNTCCVFAQYGDRLSKLCAVEADDMVELSESFALPNNSYTMDT